VAPSHTTCDRALLVRAEAVRARSAELRTALESTISRIAQISIPPSPSDLLRPRASDEVAEHEMNRLRTEVDQLRIALESRAVIEQAKGIVMATVRCDADAAFALLVEQSQHQNRKLRDIARELAATQSRARG
jgi:hypothetical protein